jgi:GNAT superfamily N-acetyltransferase
MLNITGPRKNTASICLPILRALPEWFGIEAALLHYEQEIEALPTFLAYSGEAALGFLSLKQHFPESAEIYVMGVHPTAHRLGIGRALLQAAEEYLRQAGAAYLQVKTLAPSHPDPGYARTRAFYRAAGFIPLEEFSQIWDASNPCLILVKRLEEY